MNAFNNTVKGYRKVTSAFGILGALGLFFMVALTFADVFMRYFFKHPIVGSQEMVEFLMIITMYGGMPIAAGKGMLITVDAVVKKFHPTVRSILRFIFTILSSACSCLMCIKIFERFLYYAANPLQVTSILKWSYAPFYCFAAIGLGLLTIELILEIGVSGIAVFGKKSDKKEAQNNE